MSRRMRLAFYLWMPICTCAACAWFRREPETRSYHPVLNHLNR